MLFHYSSIGLQLHQRREHTGARCKVLRCVEWGGPNRGPKRYRPPGTPYDQVVNQRVQGNATLTAGEFYKHLQEPAISVTALYMVVASLCAG